MSGRALAEGDVHCYGILLLEMFTEEGQPVRRSEMVSPFMTM